MANNVRRTLRLLAADALHCSALLPAWRRLRHQSLRNPEICVLALHRVLPESQWELSHSHSALVLREPTFVKLLEHLASHWHVLSMDEFLSIQSNEKQQSRPQCLLTFDDGWKDNYTIVFPHLLRYALPASIFLTTGYIDRLVRPWVEELTAACREPAFCSRIQAQTETANLDQTIERLKQMPAREREQLLKELQPPGLGDDSQVDRMMTWDEIREMSSAGINFGGHSVTHALLIYEEDATVAQEVQQCRMVLEERLGRPVRSFAYPNGDWDDRVRSAVRSSGFACAFITDPGWHNLRSDRYVIPRIMLHEAGVTGRNGEFSPAAFDFTVAGWR